MSSRERRGPWNITTAGPHLNTTMGAAETVGDSTTGVWISIGILGFLGLIAILFIWMWKRHRHRHGPGPLIRGKKFHGSDGSDIMLDAVDLRRTSTGPN